MISHRPRPSRRARRGERGAVIIEFAIVALLLMVLIAGTYDYGRAWRAGLAVNEGARAGARVGSSQGDDVNADFSLLSSTKATLESSGMLDDVDRIVIYRADAVDGDVPTACTNPSPGGTCNVLSGAQLRALPSTPTGALESNGCIKNSMRKQWCPTTRDSVQLTAEYLGVWIQTTYDYTFGLMGSSVEIPREAVMRLEPAGE